jgi:hypothetical protein
MSTITPARDAVLRAIPEIHAQCDKLVAEGSNEGDARCVKRIVPEVMLAMADEVDLEIAGPKIMASLEAAIANAIASVARTMSSKEKWDLGETATALAERIAARSIDLCMDHNVTHVLKKAKRTKRGKDN